MSGRAQTVGSWSTRRGELLEYFDRTAVEAWRRLTSDAPVGRIRATVRAGRDRMRATLIAALPADLSGRRLLDAGCGTGALALEAARRGAEVVAVDVSPTLIDLARERAAAEPAAARVHFAVGDMLDPAWGAFDHAVAMDSLIHYREEDVVAALATLTARTGTSVLFTVAPRTPALSVMHAVGKIFPRGNRSPAIVPLAPEHLAAQLGHDPRLAGYRPRRLARVTAGFYIAEAMELRADMPA
jgi:magnesium-protoporphyrin O-methyltransferase